MLWNKLVRVDSFQTQTINDFKQSLYKSDLFHLLKGVLSKPSRHCALHLYISYRIIIKTCSLVLLNELWTRLLNILISLWGIKARGATVQCDKLAIIGNVQEHFYLEERANISLLSSDLEFRQLNPLVVDRWDALQGIQRLMYVKFGWALLSIALVFAYLPAKPSEAPTLVADADRATFARGLRNLLCSWTRSCAQR